MEFEDKGEYICNVINLVYLGGKIVIIVIRVKGNYIYYIVYKIERWLLD